MALNFTQEQCLYCQSTAYIEIQNTGRIQMNSIWNILGNYLFLISLLIWIKWSKLLQILFWSDRAGFSNQVSSFSNHKLRFSETLFQERRIWHEKRCYIYAIIGHGPRMCLARRFAILETKIVLIRLVREYKFVWSTENPEELNLTQAITNVPDGAILIKLEKRMWYQINVLFPFWWHPLSCFVNSNAPSLNSENIPWHCRNWIRMELKLTKILLEKVIRSYR